MTITSLPAAPARSDPPAEFITKADAFVAALAQLVTEVNAATLALNLNATSDTSSTSNSIGTGAKTFTVSASKSFLGGMFIVIADTAAPSTNSMIAQVTSYNSGTGALVVDVKSTFGSGTFTSWTISQTTNPIPLNNSVATASIQDLAITTAKLAAGVANGLALVTLDVDADFVVIADANDAGNVKKAAIPAASQAVKGAVELATSAEAIAGSDAVRAITPATLFGGLNASGTAPIYACRAWVNFNGTGTVAIRAAGNVGSITDNGVGDFNVNFTTSMPDANYSASIASRSNGASTGFFSWISSSAPPVAGSLRLSTVDQTTAARDSDMIEVSIFR